MNKPFLNYPLALAMSFGSLGLMACGGGDDPQDALKAELQNAPDMEVQYVVGHVDMDADDPTDAGQDMEKAATAPTFLTPSLVRAAYGLGQISNAANPATMGQGQTIAIIVAYHNPTIANDLTQFSQRFSLPACAAGCFSVVYTKDGQPTTSPPVVNTMWSTESSLDVLWAHATAPLAKIVLVEAASASATELFAAAAYAANTLGANVVSMSFGAREWSGIPAFTKTYLSNPRTSFVAASGDVGSGVLYPAASRSALGVGGTTLSVSSTGAYLSESAWKNSSGGVSQYEAMSPAWPSGTPAALISAWQAAAAKGGGRPVPDVALNASSTMGYYVVSQTGLGVGRFAVVGGTSAGTPQWAGIVAIANAMRAQKGKPMFSTVQDVASSNASLHAALNLWSTRSTDPQAYTSLFNDITTLANGSCGVLCNAGAGRDLVTGLGSPKLGALLPALVAY